jgi:hypothetical protein
MFFLFMGTGWAVYELVSEELEMEVEFRIYSWEFDSNEEEVFIPLDENKTLLNQEFQPHIMYVLAKEDLEEVFIPLDENKTLSNQEFQPPIMYVLAKRGLGFFISFFDFLIFFS